MSENNETPNRSKTETVKTSLEIFTVVATAAVAAKTLWDTGMDVKEAIRARRAAKIEAEEEI